MDLVQRKSVDLQRKLSSIEEEFKTWQKLSERGKPFEKHHTQIRRITDLLDSLLAKIRTGLKDLQDRPAQVVALARACETNILELYRIWEYFRSKLALRRIDRFEQYLEAADEFAWACYRPARDRALQAREKGRKGQPASPLFPPDKFKGPPLVFLNSGWSPFTVPRDFAFQASLTPGGLLKAADFAAVTQALPIPVIGVPWYQVEHLPEALAIAHEVGHDVEKDFGLLLLCQTAVLNALQAHEVPAHRQEAWMAWLPEVFADVYGNLAVGPAYAGCLADILADDAQTIQQEWLTNLNWGHYPPTTLRLLLNWDVLERQGFEKESTLRKEAWLKTYPKHAMAAFEPDLPHVVKALLEARFPQLNGATLPAILSFRPLDHKDATAAAEAILEERNLTEKDLRRLFAAARLAFEKNPADYGNKKAQQRILDRVLEVRESGERVLPGGADEQEKRKEVTKREQEDREMGEYLFQVLLAAHQERPSEALAPP